MCATFYEAAHVILTRPVKWFRLKSWAMRVAMRTGMRKAKVALARKLAVVLHRMLADNQPFDFCAPLRRPTEQGGITSSGVASAPAARSRSLSPGRWIRRGRKMPVAPPSDHGDQIGRPAPPTPSGGGRAPTPTEARYRRQDQGSNEG